MVPYDRGVDSAASFTRLRLDDPERLVRVARDIGVSTFGLNLVLLRAGQRMRIHRHRRQEEVYVVVRGILTLLIEQEEHTLEVGDVARIAPPVRRQLVNHGTELCAILALGGAEPHDGRDAEAFLDWGDEHGLEPRDVPLPGDVPASPPA